MSPLPRAIGVVMVVVGAVWLLQGIGLAKGSVMTGKPVWAVIGAALVIGGLTVLRRSLNAAKRAIEAERSAEASTSQTQRDAVSDEGLGG